MQATETGAFHTGAGTVGAHYRVEAVARVGLFLRFRFFLGGGGDSGRPRRLC